MNDDDYKAAMRSMGQACQSYLDDLLIEVARTSPPPALVLPGGPLTPQERSRRFDALANPTKASDYGESLPLGDYLAELAARGLDKPDWMPKPGR